MEFISHEGVNYAIIIRANFVHDKIWFPTSPSTSMQVGYLPHLKGSKIEPHFHISNERLIRDTLEVLFVRKGEIRVDFYNRSNEFALDVTLYANDTILLLEGGHGFEMLENTELIEVKQGPYIAFEDKVRFKGI